MTTRTGRFDVGARQGWTGWQRDLPGFTTWLKATGYSAIDLGGASAAEYAAARATGLRVGSVDLLDFGNLLSTDAGKRKELVERNVAHVKALSAAGAKAFFTCILPGDVAAKRADNYRLTVDTYAPIAEAAAAGGAAIAIEGYPGGWPHYAALCCTPETVRAILKDLPRGVGINYDPSHLIRLGVDPVRFLDEFGHAVRHVHAKETQMLYEAVYEYGLYQGAAFAPGHGFGDHVWRYTLPGHGVTPWTVVLGKLAALRFDGVVSVELEDEHFNGTDAGEKAGLVASLEFLKGV